MKYGINVVCIFMYRLQEKKFSFSKICRQTRHFENTYHRIKIGFKKGKITQNTSEHLAVRDIRAITEKSWNWVQFKNISHRSWFSAANLRPYQNGCRSFTHWFAQFCMSWGKKSWSDDHTYFENLVWFHIAIWVSKSHWSFASMFYTYDVMTRSHESRDHLLWPIMAMWKELNIWLGHQIKCIETMGREFNWTASRPWLFHCFHPERVYLFRSPRVFRRSKSYRSSRGCFAVQRIIRCNVLPSYNQQDHCMNRWWHCYASVTI